MSTIPTSSIATKTAGSLLIGHLLHLALFGVLSVQVYIYYLAFPLDPPKRKALVHIIYIVEFVQVILMSTMAFKEFASGFGNYPALDDMGLLWLAVPIVSSIVAAVVQIFYAYRIKILADSFILPVLVILIALIQLGGGISLGILGEQNPLFCEQVFNRKIVMAAGIWNAGSALCDVIIAASMTYYLSRRKSEWKQTQRGIQKLIRLIIETGTLTATVAIANLALYLIVPSHPAASYYQTTSAVLGKMYSTSMMVVLNSRIVFSRNDTTSHEIPSVSHQEMRPKPVFSTVHGGIMVTREHWSDPLDSYKLPGDKDLPISPDNVRAASNA